MATTALHRMAKSSMLLRAAGRLIPPLLFAGAASSQFTLRVCIINHRSRRDDFDLFVREADSVVAAIRVGRGLRQRAAR